MLARRFASSLKNKIPVRNYAVLPTTEKANDDSLMNYTPINVVERQWKRAQLEQKLLNLFQLLQPYKVSADFIKFANNNTNKELKESKQLGGNTEFDIASQLDSQYIEVTESQLKTLFGEGYKDVMNEFFIHKPELSAQTMESYLRLNPEEYTKIQAQRTEKLLDLCVNVANAKKQ